jgi:hypothetical protein
MFIRFESSIGGANFSYAPGDVCEWPDDAEAQRMIERGIATELLDRKSAETAAAASGRPVRRHRAPETATRRPQEMATAR